MDLGLFEISKGPSQQGLLDFRFFEISNGPSQQGLGASSPMLGHCQHVKKWPQNFEFSKGPSQQGPLDIGLFEISNGPSQVIAKTL